MSNLNTLTFEQENKLEGGIENTPPVEILHTDKIDYLAGYKIDIAKVYFTGFDNDLNNTLKEKCDIYTFPKLDKLSETQLDHFVDLAFHVSVEKHGAESIELIVESNNAFKEKLDYLKDGFQKRFVQQGLPDDKISSSDLISKDSDDEYVDILKVKCVDRRFTTGTDNYCREKIGDRPAHEILFPGGSNCFTDEKFKEAFCGAIDLSDYNFILEFDHEECGFYQEEGLEELVQQEKDNQLFTELLEKQIVQPTHLSYMVSRRFENKENEMVVTTSDNIKSIYNYRCHGTQLG